MEEIYPKNDSVYDEIVAVNMVVFLVRIGLAKIDSKDSKISYNEGMLAKVLKQAKESSIDKTMAIINDAQLEHFIGAYSFITMIKKDVRLATGVCERPLSEREQKLSLAENAHKM